MNKPEKVKPVYLKDYERQRLLEKGELAGLSDDEEEEDEKRRILAYNDEQKQLKSRLVFRGKGVMNEFVWCVHIALIKL